MDVALLLIFFEFLSKEIVIGVGVGAQGGLIEEVHALEPFERIRKRFRGE